MTTTRAWVFAVAMMWALVTNAEGDAAVSAARAEFQRQNPGAVIVKAVLVEESESYAVVNISYHWKNGGRRMMESCFLKRSTDGWLFEGCNLND